MPGAACVATGRWTSNRGERIGPRFLGVVSRGRTTSAICPPELGPDRSRAHRAQSDARVVRSHHIDQCTTTPNGSP